MAAESGVEVAPVGAPSGLEALEAALRKEPTSFEFFQAVRVLERLRPERQEVGRFADPAEEVVRFSVNPSIAFPPSELLALELPEDAPARMQVNFLGLTGPLGVLPHHYSLLVAERLRARDRALADFLDLFHHRLISLFYRAWAKHRFGTAEGERQWDLLTTHLRDLVGLGVEGYAERAAPSVRAAAMYAGLVAGVHRGAAGLEQLLTDYFGVQARVEQFVGGWYPVGMHDLCALDEEAPVPANSLGLGALVGDEVWDQQARVRVRLGPLTREEYDSFLPTGKAHDEIRELTRYYADDRFDFELQLVLARDEVPGCVLGAEAADPQPLGWMTWIRSAAFPRDADETILTL